MWIAKFRTRTDLNRVTKIIGKHNVTAYYYPVNHYIKNKRFHFFIAVIFEGKKEKLQALFQELKKTKKAKQGRRVEHLEIEGNMGLMVTSHSINEESKRFIKVFYNPAVIHLKPVRFYKLYEEWEIASIDRNSIEKMIKVLQTIGDFKLHSFYWKKVKNIGFLTLLPELTVKQKEALELCLKEGYYKYPRKISLDKLSKKSKKAFSTFQAHVRKAENKILSFAIRKFGKN